MECAEKVSLETGALHLVLLVELNELGPHAIVDCERSSRSYLDGIGRGCIETKGVLNNCISRMDGVSRSIIDRISAAWMSGDGVPLSTMSEEVSCVLLGPEVPDDRRVVEACEMSTDLESDLKHCMGCTDGSNVARCCSVGKDGNG